MGVKGVKANTRGKVVDGHAPDIIVDFIFDDGLLFVSVENIGAVPALKISVRFDKSFYGSDQKKDLSRLPLFRTIEFLAPKKAIRTLIDTSASYFARKQPKQLSAVISFRDRSGRTYKSVINHDLQIYEDISYVVPPMESN